MDDDSLCFVLLKIFILFCCILDLNQIKINMDKIKVEPTVVNNNDSRYCQFKLESENELLKRINERETEILNLKQEILNFKAVNKRLHKDLKEKDNKL